MATAVACRRPAPPIIRMYIHEMGRIDAEPNGADETGPKASLELYSEFAASSGWLGRKGTRCFLLENTIGFEVAERREKGGLTLRWDLEERKG